MTNTTQHTLPEAQQGPAEKLLDLVLSSSAHLWHNRPGVNVGGRWQPAPRQRGRAAPADSLPPGLFVPAAVELYRRLLEIYQLNAELMAHFASYALVETDWRDLKVACAALMLVQPNAGQPIKGDDGKVSFHEDDHRVIGEAMLLKYAKKSPRMMTPKGILRVAELLETTEIAALNRRAGFGDPASTNAPLGRYKQAATKWLAIREKNLAMLEGLVAAGYKETIKKIARKVGYKPESPAFFEVLGWKQKQAAGGHRTVGLTGMKLHKRERFDGLSEAEICEWIAEDKLGYKDVVGRLPKEIGLTPAIMVATLPSLSDKDLRIMTPTLEELGLLSVPEIRARWEKAIAEATDQRALNIAKNVRSKVIRDKLEEAADNAAKNAVAAATKPTAGAPEPELHVMFLIDKSGSMGGAIEASKEALSRMLAGFPPERLYIATFDTMGTVLVPKAPTRQAVQHMLAKVSAGGGTIHGAAVRAIAQKGVRVPPEAKLIVIVVGDECGEDGAQLARTFAECSYTPSAIALILNVTNVASRGTTVRQCAATMRLPYSEVAASHFDDPYQVTRVLKTLLEAPAPPPGAAGAAVRQAWVDKVMQTPLLTLA